MTSVALLDAKMMVKKVEETCICKRVSEHDPSKILKPNLDPNP